MGKTTTKSHNESPINFGSVFWTKDAYRHVATEFYPCHSKQLNLILHVIGAGIQMWGAVQLLSHWHLSIVVYVFATYVGITVPFVTGILHTLLFAWFLATPLPSHTVIAHLLPDFVTQYVSPYVVTCILAFGCGFLKDVGHHVCHEPPFIGNYVKERPYMFFFHATWHLPFLIDAYSPFSTVYQLKANSKTL